MAAPNRLHCRCCAANSRVAIDNAELFTAVQNARIYNEILVQNLTTGVVAADADGHITVFNQEAAQIAGLNTNGVERTVNDLPAPLREIIQTTLTSGERLGRSGSGAGWRDIRSCQQRDLPGARMASFWARSWW